MIKGMPAPWMQTGSGPASERDPEAEVVIAADRLGLAPEDGPRWALPSVPEKNRLP
jgi:hypothetical protein